jgi:hypothetical protein
MLKPRVFLTRGSKHAVEVRQCPKRSRIFRPHRKLGSVDHVDLAVSISPPGEMEARNDVVLGHTT